MYCIGMGCQFLRGTDYSMRYQSIYWLLILCWCCSFSSKAQSMPPDTMLRQIRSITFEGNKTTRPFILLRELTIQSGDWIRGTDVDAVLETNRTRLLNMQLFSIVDVSVPFQNDTIIDIHFALREVLYWLPKPIFSLADRNFNVWWVEQQHDFSRTNIGFELNRVNFRGRDEKINLILQAGYNKLFNLSYRVPYVNKAMTIGLNAGVTYATGRETYYTTQDNKLLFYNSEKYPYQTMQFRMGASYRGAYATVHDVQVSYNQNRISNEFHTLSPNYLGGGTSLRWIELMYAWQYNRTDARVYPTQGKEWKGKITLREMNTVKPSVQFQWYSEAGAYFKVHSRWSWALNAKARISFANNTPYYFNRALGFQSSYIRGYEYYVVDGTHFAMLRNALRFQIVNKVFKQRAVPLMTYIPLRIFAKAYNDLGWVNASPVTRQSFNNRLLNGYGVGIDILISYYARLRIEYSFNHLGENGLFLHAIKE